MICKLCPNKAVKNIKTSKIIITEYIAMPVFFILQMKMLTFTRRGCSLCFVCFQTRDTKC